MGNPARSQPGTRTALHPSVCSVPLTQWPSHFMKFCFISLPDNVLREACGSFIRYCTSKAAESDSGDLGSALVCVRKPNGR